MWIIYQLGVMGNYQLKVIGNNKSSLIIPVIEVPNLLTICCNLSFDFLMFLSYFIKIYI